MATQPPSKGILFGVIAVNRGLISEQQFQDTFDVFQLDDMQALQQRIADEMQLSGEEFSTLEQAMMEELSQHEGDVDRCLDSALSDSIRQFLSNQLGVSTDKVKLIGDKTLASFADRSQGEFNRLDTVAGDAHENNSTASELRDTPGYEIQNLQDQGGIGRVWSAIEFQTQRRVALKELRDEKANNPRAISRFLLEAQITAQLEHPGIVPIYELVTPDNRSPFYSMRLLKGENLRVALREFHSKRQAGEARKTDLLALLQKFGLICEAISYAHSRGVIHRDIKSTNIVSGDFGEAMLLDWGLAKILPQSDLVTTEQIIGQLDPTIQEGDANGSTSVDTTRDGQAVGTPAYMSPEQAEGRNDEVDERSDIYSLGIVLYEILTGKLPFNGNTFSEIKGKVVSVPPQVPRAIVDGVDPALESICLKAISKNPEARYQTVTAMHDDIQRFLAGDQVVAYQEPLNAKFSRWLRNNKTVAATAVAAISLTCVFMSISYVQEKQVRIQLSELNNELTSNEQELEAALQSESAALKAAENSRDKARQDQAKALKQQLRAEAITDVLIESLRSPDPSMSGQDVKVVDILGPAERIIQRRFRDDVVTKAELETAIAETYMNLGVYDKAERLFVMANDQLKNELEANDSTILSAEFNLATIKAHQGEYSKAIPMLQAVIKKRTELLGQSDSSTLKAITTLGTALIASGQPEPAKELLEANLAMQREHQPDNLRENQLTIQALAGAVQNLGDIETAISLFDESLQLHLEAYGEEHPYTLLALSNYIGALSRNGRTDDALIQSEKLVSLSIKVLGEEHPATLLRKSNRATYLMPTKRFDESLEILNPTVKSLKKVLGDRHPTTLKAMNNQATSLINLGQADKALPIMESLVTGFMETLGPAAASTQLAKYNYGSMLFQVKQTEKAREVFEELKNDQKQTLPRTLKDYLDSCNVLAMVAEKLGDQQGMIDAYQEAIDYVKENDHWDVNEGRVAYAKLAQLYRAKGDYELAISTFVELENNLPEDTDAGQLMNLSTFIAQTMVDNMQWEEAYARFEVLAKQWDEVSENNANGILARTNMGACLRQQGKYEEAIAIYRDVIPRWKARAGVESRYTQSTIGYLADALKASGQTEEAKLVLQELLEIQIKQFGEDSDEVKETRKQLNI